MVIDNFDTSPETIRNKHGRGKKDKLNLQRTTSLGVASSTIGNTKGQTVDSGLSSGGGAGIYSFQSGVEVNPAQTSESYSDFYRQEDANLPE